MLVMEALDKLLYSIFFFFFVILFVRMLCSLECIVSRFFLLLLFRLKFDVCIIWVFRNRYEWIFQVKKKKQKTKNNFIIGIKDSESILNDNRRYKGNHTDMPTSIVCIVITSQRRMISASHRMKKKKTKERKRVAPSVVTIRSSYEWKWNMNFAWLLLRSLSFFFPFVSFKNMYNRSKCRWITHERCSRAHTFSSKS